MNERYHVGFFNWDYSVSEYVCRARNENEAKHFWFDWLKSTDYPIAAGMPCPLVYVLTDRQLVAA